MCNSELLDDVNKVEVFGSQILKEEVSKMPREKLILICQSGGEFMTNDDGSMSYIGGEAHALDVNHETQFDDLKLKVAEIANLECKTVSIKYFLPGNKRTLISLSNDKDLRRMIEFHQNSVTADVFVMGKEGFNRDNIGMLVNSRPSGIKLAETLNQVASHATVTVTPDNPVTPPCSVVAIDKTPRRRKRETTSRSKPGNPIAPSTSPITVDMTSTPADTVKRRRRAPQLKANGSDSSQETPNQIITVDVDGDFNIPSTLSISNDISLEKQVSSWKDGIKGVGQEFKSVYEFCDALQKYAIAHRFVYKLKKNDTNRASGRCVSEGCCWRIHASWVPSAKSFKIKRMVDSHTCGGQSWKSAHPTKNWLVGIIKDRLKDAPQHKPKDIAKSIFDDFGIRLNYTQVWRGIEDAREQLLGSYKEAYNQLPKLCEKIEETNPKSSSKLTVSEDKRFQRLFLSFHPLIYGFENGCRPILFLDSTSLKSKYQETFLAATSLDGDDGLFPVAFAIVDVESDNNWQWFLEELKCTFSNSRQLTFVFDREKRLNKVVPHVFENAYCGYSIPHLIDSFKGSLKGPFHGDGKGSLPISFIGAAHAVRVDGFKKFTEQIKRVSLSAYGWVMEIEPEHWANAYFKGELYNHCTLLNGENLYSTWIEEARELPIVQKINALCCKTMDLLNTRRMDMSKWCSRLTPSKELKIKDETSKARGLKVLFSSDTLFEVHDDSIHVVNIDSWDCSCLLWKSTGIPCSHAIAVFNCTGKSLYDYCSRYFKVDSFHVTYSKYISPILSNGKLVEKLTLLNPEKEDYSDFVGILPPCPSRQVSQQKVKKTKIERAVKRDVSCSRCKESGHNKATCKAVL